MPQPMKYICVSILLFFCLNLKAQTTNIPDGNFEQELVDQGIDTNGLNGNILDTDAQAVTNLALAGTTISDITGINAFTNLTDLDLGNNQVVNVSLTALTQLVNFRTNDNAALSSIDLTQNTLLETFFAHGDFPGAPPPITQIDLSQNINLVSINGDFLDNVTDFIFPVTPTLTTIFLRYLADPTIDVSGLTNLESFRIGGWRSNVALVLPNTNSLRNLSITSIEIVTIDLSAFTNLETLYLWGTYVQNLILPNSNAFRDIFIILHDIQNPLDFSVVPNLEDIDITSNRNTPLVVDLTQNPVLEDLDLSRNDMNSIDLTQNTLLETLRIDSNNLTALDLTQNTVLTRLSARSNQLPTIDLTQNVILRYLYLSNNLLPVLDLTQNIDLYIVDISNNLFTTTGLDLTQNVELLAFYASYNQIESLDITQNARLSTLVLDYNLFTGTSILDQFYTIRLNDNGIHGGSLIVSYNMLSGQIPDYASLIAPRYGIQPIGFSLAFDNNAFEFGHFENEHADYYLYDTTFGPPPYWTSIPNIRDYFYAPQAKIDVIQTINANAGDAVTLTTVCAGAQNHYQWFKDGVPIPGAPDSPNYTIPAVNSCDFGVYHSEVTSDLVPFENANPPGTNGKNLLLIRNDITLNVTSPAESCVNLTSPLDGSTNVPLNEVITWSENFGACGYYISAGTTPGGTDILNNADIGDVDNFAFPTNLPPNTQIYITITPYYYSGNALTCAEESFTTGTTTVIPDCTILSSPLDGELDVALETDISWDDIANADGYRLTIGTTSGGTDILNDFNVGNQNTYDLPADLPQGTVIYVSIIPYNIAGDATGCLEESFTTISTCSITADILTDESACDSFILQPLTSGNYFTATGGGGTPLNAGDTITTSQTIYIYAETGTTPNCSDESSFDVTINTSPTVDVLVDESACDSFILQPLTIGNYFTATGGGGTPLNAGDTITTSQTIYIYAETGTTPNCSDESSFDVTINTTSTVDVLTDESACDNFILQPLTSGNYFTATGGGGTPLNAGDTITTSQTIYIYAETGTTPNCSDESSFDVTINTSIDFDLSLANIVIENQQNITVNMTNTSIDYQYSVDGSSYQNDNQFFGLEAEYHTLSVIDENGCVEKSITFEIIIFTIPSFFTPNGDAYNQTWKVIDTDNVIKTIYIFDRYGKLLKQLSPSSVGWDGTYNGNPMPTSNYWYVIEKIDGTALKGGFALKR